MRQGLVLSKNVDVPSGSRASHDAALTFSTSADFDLPRGIEWDNSYKVQPVVTDFDKTSQHAESVLEFDIWGPLELDVSFIFDRVRRPEATSTTTPKSNDFRLSVGLAFDI